MQIILKLLAIIYNNVLLLFGLVAVAMFRMPTGRDYMQNHLHRIQISRSLSCSLCNAGHALGLNRDLSMSLAQTPEL